MVLRKDNPWEYETRQSLVSVGTHRLHVQTSGPARKSGAHVIVFFTGGGLPALLYRRLQTLLSVSFRVYFYDRAGYGLSERGPQKFLTAQDAATDLRRLLARIGVEPPYLLFGHSYGCIIARAFLDLRPAAIAGLVLAEAATELMYQAFPHIPDPALSAVADGIDFATLTHLRHESRLSGVEWNAALCAIAHTTEAARAEDTHASGMALAKRQQLQRCILGTCPVVVIRCNMAKDFQDLYDAGVSRGNGTEEQREQAERFIDNFKTFDDELRAAQLRLSRCSKYVCYDHCRHDDIVRRPQVYVQLVQSMIDPNT